jgi:hypothetical protein
MSKAVKTKVIYDSTAGEASGSHFTKGGSLRSSGRIRRRIVLGEKFDYGEKAKEKVNYILYISGQGQEKKEIEEMEEIYGGGKKKEKIVEEKQLIDNYQYHETKDIKKKNPKNSQTHHERLCSPFERTKIKKYSSYTSEPKKTGFKIIKTTDLVNKNDYSRNLKPHNKFSFYNMYNSNTTELKRDNSSSRVFETYKQPSRNKSIDTMTYRAPSRPKLTATKVRNISMNNSQRTLPVINGQKRIDHLQVNYTKTRQINVPQKAINYEIQNGLSANRSYKQLPLNKMKAKVPMPVNRIKYGSQLKGEKRLFEGPKIQLIGSERPRAVNSRNGSYSRLPRPQKIIKQKKGYIPFGGHGKKVGHGQLEEKIPRPKPRLSKGNMNLTNVSQISRNNMGNIHDIGKENVQVNRSYAQFSTNTQTFKKNPKIFPGKGIRVGGSGLKQKIGLSYDYSSVLNHSECNTYNHKMSNHRNEEFYEERLYHFGEG